MSQCNHMSIIDYIYAYLLGYQKLSLAVTLAAVLS